MDTKKKTVVYDVEDIMELLDIGHSRAYALMKAKGFPSIKIGRQFKVPRAAFERWLEVSASGQEEYLSDKYTSAYDAILNARAS
ncbi:MAG: helix-turn-helix domain-containing protein [Clostridia bacterium]|nr:helix-turn-helix domain-containing protein [Clostridia bacterium]